MLETSPPPAFHILALSGGGFRGLYTATVLKCLEESLGAPLADRFDLLCGTSVGGLLALGLAAEISCAELQALFERDGRQIFSSRGFWRRLLGQWLTAKHSAHGLRSVLAKYYADKTLGDLTHRVLIPSVNYSSGKGQFFKTPHAPSFEFDHLLRLVEVGLATTAAPTYFPIHRINGEGAFVDGGLIGNSPGLFGLHEARHALSVSTDVPVRVLAIGTMTLGATLPGSADPDQGICRWGAKVFDLVISAQESAADSMLKHSLGDQYYRIDDLATPDQSEDISALDVVSLGAINVLKERGKLAARRTLGDEAFDAFKTHVAGQPIFFHGPNKTDQGSSC